jgi:uncharacterized membrane protein
MQDASNKEAHLRSLAKAVSWRLVGSTDTLILSYLVTGNLVWAGSIVGLEAFTKVALYYLHERAWRRVPWRDERSHARGVLKGFTWRMAATLDTFTLSWIVTGHPGVAAAVASFETVTKIGLFWLHEQAWARLPWGRVAAAPLPETLPVV